MRVLIVEDDLHIKIFRVRTLELGARNGLMGILTSLALFRAQALFEVASSCSDIAYEVESASTPNEALARLASERFDLVLLDFMMQDATGEQVVPRVRSLAGDSTSVVVISSYKELDMIEACLRAGADAYMVKPLQLDQVRAPPINKTRVACPLLSWRSHTLPAIYHRSTICGASAKCARAAPTTRTRLNLMTAAPSSPQT